MQMYYHGVKSAAQLLGRQPRGVRMRVWPQE
jgi:hypothetical protein